MALEPRDSHYPLFIEPHAVHVQSPEREQHRDLPPPGQESSQLPQKSQTLSDVNPARCIIDKIRTIKLDTPALRRAQMAFQHPPRSSSLARAPPQGEPSAFVAYGQSVRGGEPSAYAITTSRLQAVQAISPQARPVERNNSHSRNESLQQRRAQAALTITSPTARQARGRPAGPMIWLPDEQVWLLADSDAAAAASSGIAYPSSAPLREAARTMSPAPPRGRTRGVGQENERNRLHRSDSSPIRTQFLRLIVKNNDDTSFSAQDWTQPSVTTGPSAAEEDAVWYAEQQARSQLRRDQDRFSPMLQQALVGVDLDVDLQRGSEYLMVPGEDDPMTARAMRRSSTLGDLDNIANVLNASGPGPRRTIAQRRSGSLRSRVSRIGDDDYDAQAATLHIRDVMEGAPRRRYSADEAGTPRTGNEQSDDYGHEWLASLVAQGIVPEGLFTPRASVVDGLEAEGSNQGALVAGLDDFSSAGRGGLFRSVTTAGAGIIDRDRWMSVSTAAGDEARASVEVKDGGEVSPVSTRGRESVYE